MIPYALLWCAVYTCLHFAEGLDKMFLFKICVKTFIASALVALLQLVHTYV
jgi:hypothetical protein